MRISKASQKALDVFNDAALVWGWEQDQGVGPGIDHARFYYNDAKLRLVKRIAQLESAQRRTGKALRELRVKS